jgi:hypothetical protein
MQMHAVREPDGDKKTTSCAHTTLQILVCSLGLGRGGLADKFILVSRWKNYCERKY